MVAKSATHVLWNSSEEGLGIYISGGYILSCMILFGFYLLRCTPVMQLAHRFDYQKIWSRGHGSIQGMTTSAQIYPHSSYCPHRYVLNSECHPTRLSSPPRPRQQPRFIGPQWQHHDRSVLDKYLTRDVAPSVTMIVLKNGMYSIFRWHIGLWLSQKRAKEVESLRKNDGWT